MQKVTMKDLQKVADEAERLHKIDGSDVEFVILVSAKRRGVDMESDSQMIGTFSAECTRGFLRASVRAFLENVKESLEKKESTFDSLLGKLGL